MTRRTSALAVVAALALVACVSPALADTPGSPPGLTALDDDPDPMTAAPQARKVAWTPNAGAQTRFLATSAYEGLYGGAAGGGKSEALLAGALRHIKHPRYNGII